MALRGASLHVFGLATLVLTIVLSLFVLLVPSTYIDAAVKVNGYFRKDGTYVQPHYRSNPDGNPYNNWSYPGNTNPYTGEVAPGNPDTYLQNYYDGLGTTGGGSYASPAVDSGSTGSYFRSVDGGYYYGSMLFCNSGYYESGASCLKAPAHATAYGSTSFYCESGYYRDGGECRSVPDHAYALGESWQCSSGYFKQGDQCVAPENGWMLGGQLSCKTGYVASNSQCISHTEDCRLYFGDHVTGSVRLGGGSSCLCESGYTWNNTQTACVQNSPIVSSAVSGVSAQDLQKQIQALLATIAALQSQLAALGAR
jgi:hypothetical protein